MKRYTDNELEHFLNDDGSPSGITVIDQLLLTLSDISRDGNILPLPVMTVEKRFLKKSEMAVITVMPSDMPPVKYEGRTWIRTGLRRAVANEQEERMLIERRRYKNLPYDLQPVPQAKLSDLSRVFFEEEFLPNAIAPEIMAKDTSSYEERLAGCRMILSPDDPVPTILGVLTLAKNPHDFIPCARIQFLRFRGVKWSDDIVDELRIDGTISKQIEQLDQKLISHNRVVVDIKSSAKEQRYYQYPMVALQQLTRNAIMHRSYEGTNAPIMVYMFDDRIEISNAGGLYGRVTPENFGQSGVADYRNPNVAEVMKILNHVQRFGVGIQMAQNELKANKSKAATFKHDPTNTMCTIWALGGEDGAGQVTGQVSDEKILLVSICCGEMSRKEIQTKLKLKSRDNFEKLYLKPALENELIEVTIPDKPNSRLQKYRLTQKGKELKRGK